MDAIPEELSQLKVAELKELCSNLGLSKTGTKKELIARINVATESEKPGNVERDDETGGFESFENGVTGKKIASIEDADVLEKDTDAIEATLDDSDAAGETQRSISVPDDANELTVEPVSDDDVEKTPVLSQENAMDNERSSAQKALEETQPEETEVPLLDLDVDAEDESFLDDTRNSEELTVNIEQPMEQSVQSTALETPTAEDGEVITPRSVTATSDKDRSRDDGEIDDDDSNQINDEESTVKERESKRRREKSDSKGSNREQSVEKPVAEKVSMSQPVQEKEDTSRQVEGTVQKTVVVPAQGDRPSFDIKIVNPVRTTSKPVKIRKRHEATEGGKDEDEKKSSGSKDKKRKWATGGGSSGGGTLSGTSTSSNDPPQNSSNIVISTDVLNNIVSSKSGTSEVKEDSERENRKSKKSKSRSSGHRHESAEPSPSKQGTVESSAKDDDNLAIDVNEKRPQNEEEEESVSPTEKNREKDKENGDGEKRSHSIVRGKVSKEEDLEEGEHKAKHVQISFSDVETSQALKTVKVKGKPTEEATATPDAAPIDEGEKSKSKPTITLGPLPKREPEQEVPPARNPVSTIVHVMRLTRPFTEGQLKSMLANFGEMEQEEFWIDDIKSQCYVKFKQEDSAKQCREALFGCKWPSTNPKTLKLEFVSQIQLDDVRGVLKKITKRRSDSGDRFGWNGRVEHLGRSGDKNAPGGRKSPNIIRTATGLESRSRRTKEWKRRSRSDSHESFSDYPIGNKMAKVDQQHSPSRSGHPQEKSRRSGDARDDIGKSSARRELEMRDRYQDRMEQKRKEEEQRLRKEHEQKEKAAPVKLLDDLFRKTKADPCIYWLPLTTEEEMVARDRKRAAEKLQNPGGILPDQLISPEQHRKRRGSSSSGSPSPAKRGGAYGGGNYYNKPPRRDYSSPPGGSQRYPTGAGSGYRNRKGPSPPFYGRSGGRPSNSGGYRPSGGGSSRQPHRDHHHSGRYR